MLTVKLALLLVILIVGAAGAALPILRHSTRPSVRLLGWGNSFAAGVFLAAGIVHVLPDADGLWTGLGWQYPMAFALAALAFALMLLVEHVLLPESAHEEVHAPSSERFASLAHPHHDALPAYAVLIALSIHSLLEGLALGAQPALDRAVVLSLAILAHKSASGFALGVSLARSRLEQRLSVRLVGLFAISTPIGGLIGVALGQVFDGRLGATLEATLLSIAAGTFVYVATFDILRDEFPAPGGRLVKWLVLTAGIVAMSALALWV